MKRRTAIKNALAGTGSLALMGSFKNLETLMHPLDNAKIGVQLFTIPGLVDSDFPGTLKMLAEIGYKELEFFGPYPSSSEQTKMEWEQFKGMLKLNSNAFYGHTVEETSKLLKEHSLSAPSMHGDLVSLRTNLSSFLDGLAHLGSKYIVLPAIMDLNERNNRDGYMRLAEEFNGFGEKMTKYGMKFVYHNHGYEHVEYDGDAGLDILLKNTNSDYVQFEMDIFWMSAAGADPLEYLEKYPGRFKLLHLKDASEKFRFSGDGSTPDQWMAGFPKMADPGDGVLDVKSIVEKASASGAEHFFLERDLAPEPSVTLKNSFKNLTGMI